MSVKHNKQQKQKKTKGTQKVFSKQKEKPNERNFKTLRKEGNKE